MALGPTHKKVQDALKASDKKAGQWIKSRGLEGDAAWLHYLRVRCETMEALLLMLAREIEMLKKQKPTDAIK